MIQFFTIWGADLFIFLFYRKCKTILSVSLCVSLCLYVSLCVSMCSYVSLSLSLYLCLSASLSLCLSVLLLENYRSQKIGRRVNQPNIQGTESNKTFVFHRQYRMWSPKKKLLDIQFFLIKKADIGHAHWKIK